MKVDSSLPSRTFTLNKKWFILWLNDEWRVLLFLWLNWVPVQTYHIRRTWHWISNLQFEQVAVCFHLRREYLPADLHWLGPVVGNSELFLYEAAANREYSQLVLRHLLVEVDSDLVATYAHRCSFDVDFNRELFGFVVLDFDHQTVREPSADVVEESNADIDGRVFHKVTASGFAEYAESFVVGEVLLLRLLELSVGDQRLPHLGGERHS